MSISNDRWIGRVSNGVPFTISNFYGYDNPHYSKDPYINFELPAGAINLTVTITDNNTGYLADDDCWFYLRRAMSMNSGMEFEGPPPEPELIGTSTSQWNDPNGLFMASHGPEDGPSPWVINVPDSAAKAGEWYLSFDTDMEVEPNYDFQPGLLNGVQVTVSWIDTKQPEKRTLVVSPNIGTSGPFLTVPDNPSQSQLIDGVDFLLDIPANPLENSSSFYTWKVRVPSGWTLSVVLEDNAEGELKNQLADVNVALILTENGSYFAPDSVTVDGDVSRVPYAAAFPPYYGSIQTDASFKDIWVNVGNFGPEYKDCRLIASLTYGYDNTVDATAPPPDTGNSGKYLGELMNGQALHATLNLTDNVNYDHDPYYHIALPNGASNFEVIVGSLGTLPKNTQIILKYGSPSPGSSADVDNGTTVFVTSNGTSGGDTTNYIIEVPDQYAVGGDWYLSIDADLATGDIIAIANWDGGQGGGVPSTDGWIKVNDALDSLGLLDDAQQFNVDEGMFLCTFNQHLADYEGIYANNYDAIQGEGDTFYDPGNWGSLGKFTQRLADPDQDTGTMWMAGQSEDKLSGSLMVVWGVCPYYFQLDFIGGSGYEAVDLNSSFAQQVNPCILSCVEYMKVHWSRDTVNSKASVDTIEYNQKTYTAWENLPMSPDSFSLGYLYIRFGSDPAFENLFTESYIDVNTNSEHCHGGWSFYSMQNGIYLLQGEGNSLWKASTDDPNNNEVNDIKPYFMSRQLAENLNQKFEAAFSAGIEPDSSAALRDNWWAPFPYMFNTGADGTAQAPIAGQTYYFNVQMAFLA